MDCWNLRCNLKAKESIECTRCHMRIYCSERCLNEDWESFHSFQCRKHNLDLSDFLPMPTRSFLGKGTYGEVQLIRNKHTGQLLALKQIKKITNNHKVPLKLLYREIQLQLRLCHSNITRLHDFYETNSEVFLFLEYVDGGNLYSQIKKKLRFQEREACRYFHQICKGVQYLHENSIIHRDIKPDNILLSKTGGVKICDFGWAIAASDERSTFCGTLDYMAPEILSGCVYTNKVDIWSLGVLLYELLQGQTPFKGKNQAERLKKINENAIEFIIDISKAAKALILKLLSIDPQNRPGIDELQVDDWVLRYSCESPRACHSRQSSNFAVIGDEFEMKLSKNYPASYKRKIGYSSKISTALYSHIEDKNDSNSNSNSYVEENKVYSVCTPGEIKKKEDELSKLQMKLEGRKNSSPKGFFSKVFSVFGLG